MTLIVKLRISVLQGGEREFKILLRPVYSPRQLIEQIKTKNKKKTERGERE